MNRAERSATRAYFKAYCRLRAEQDAQWDANRKAYGHSEPAYQKPEAFRPELWAKWCRDRTHAINVVAASEAVRTVVEPATGSAVEIEPAREAVSQGRLF